MACPRSSWMVLASLLLVVGSGCGGDGGRPPPPRPAGSTGVGGVGGGGGAVTPPNVCECAYSTIADDACGSCVNGVAAADCFGEVQACDSDDGCKGIAYCPKQCDSLADDEKPACVQECILDSRDSSSFSLYVALLDCVCAPCAEHCAPDEPLACE